MTERQKRFVDHFVDSGNGAEAARKAGYSKNCDDVIASENLRKPNIQAAIADRMDAKGITEARLLKTLDEGLNANVVKVFNNNGAILISEPLVDHVTRHKYLETGLKLRDMFPAEKKNLTHDFITPEAEKAATERVNKLLAKKQTEANTK